MDISSFSEAKIFIKNQFEDLNKADLNLGIWFKQGNKQIRTIEDYLDAETVDKFESKKSGPKKIYAQMATQSWEETKSLDDFPHNLKREIKALYELIEKWNH